MRLHEKVPLVLQDLKFVNWVNAQYAYSKEMRGMEDLTEEQEYEKSIKEINAIRIFCAEIDRDFGSLPISLKTDSSLRYDTFSFISGVVDTDLSLLRIYFHINNMVSGYESELLQEDVMKEVIEQRAFKFYHNDKTFVLRGKDTKEIQDLYSMSANEAIAVLEFKRVAELLAKAGDLDGDNYYNALIAQLAIICRPVGIELPIDEIERAKFIERNMAELQDASFQIVRDIDFFLTLMLQASLQTAIAPYLSKDFQGLTTKQLRRAISKGLKKIGIKK
jgi:hypothetical protein